MPSTSGPGARQRYGRRFRLRRGAAVSPGFTLVEMLVCITIIAILATFLLPLLMQYVARSRVAVTRKSLVSLAKAMRRFHDDTGGWPYQDKVWTPDLGTKGPAQFAQSDTAMYAAVSGLNVCNASSGPLAEHCWGGPYLNLGTSMGDQAMQDAYGQAFYYAYIAPGTDAPNGLVVVWSSGPDQTNQTTALATIARGQPTIPDSDDLIQVVGGAQ